MRHHPKLSKQRPPDGPFRIVLTMVRADTTTIADTETPYWYQGEPSRDEEQRPERVIGAADLPADCDQEYALRRAATLAAAFSTATRADYRVKVVSAVTR